MAKDNLQYIEENTISCDVSHRGGTIKIDVSELFPEIEENAIMGAYQNYLGGGMAGSVVGGAMFEKEELDEKNIEKFEVLLEEIKKYFFFISNDLNTDDWATSDYRTNQTRPVSAY